MIKFIPLIIAIVMVAAALHAGDWEHAPNSSDYSVIEVFNGNFAAVKI